MKLLPIVCAFVFLFTVPAFAGEIAQIGCKRLVIVLAPTLSAKIVDKDWATGNSHDEPPAVLELRGCDGGLLDSTPLAAPLARIDPNPMRGAPAPTFLVSADLTQPAGAYNGPLTIPFKIVRDRLKPVSATDANGITSPIHLASMVRGDWERISLSKGDEILAVRCQSSGSRLGEGFTTYYWRYRPGRAGWTVRKRSTPNCWEFDQPFPALQLFP